MRACGTVLSAPGCAAAQRPGPVRPLQHLETRPMRASRCTGLAVMCQPPAIASSRRQQRLWPVAAAGSGGGSGGDGSSWRRGGRKKRTADPQPQLQAWLEQQQGLPAAAADEYARRLAHVFGGSQQAALDALQDTFDFCARQGLTGLQTARLLGSMAAISHASVTDFASTAQRSWLLIDGCIAAHVQRQRQAGEQVPKRASFGALTARSLAAAAAALTAPPHKVEAWLAAVGQRLSDEDIGRLLLGVPEAVKYAPETALAAMVWAVDELGMPAADVAAFMAGNPWLVKYPVTKLSANLAALQQVLQQPGAPEQQELRRQAAAELARRLIRKCPNLLGASSGTVQAAAAWLQWLFPNPEQLNALLERAPQLLAVCVERFERSAAYLQQELGWLPGDGQLAAFIKQHPQPFANLDFSGERAQLMLRFLTGVVGVAPTDCLVKYSGYLKSRLETTAARYVLVQDRAPWLLYDDSGSLLLSWITDAARHDRCLAKYGLATRAEVLAFDREWPRSEEGRRLLAALRSGSTEGWPRPSLSPSEAIEQRRQAAAAPLQRRRAAGQQAGKAAAVASSKAPRRQRRQAGQESQDQLHG